MSPTHPLSTQSSLLVPRWATRVHQPRRRLSPAARFHWNAVSADPVWRRLIDRLVDGELGDADARATTGLIDGARFDIARFGHIVVMLQLGRRPSFWPEGPDPLLAPLSSVAVCETVMQARETYAWMEETVLPLYAGYLAFGATGPATAGHRLPSGSMEVDPIDDER
jgi:hypothetical protein